MKAEDLRIGNYIDTPRGIKSIKEIGINAIGDYARFHNLHEGYYLSHCEPIPLTEEILLKCGFEKNIIAENGFINFYAEPNGIGLSFDCEADVYDKNNIVISEYYGVSLYNGVKYIHQLQNLYKALTNNELEFKP